MESQINKEGLYICEFCREPFVQKKYNIDNNLFFCLPECLVSYHWNVLGHSKNGEKTKQMYEKVFQRTVIPTPIEVHIASNYKKTRTEWLFEYCRNNRYLIKEEDQKKAYKELFIDQEIRKK
jgi:hypothetical protein